MKNGIFWQQNPSALRYYVLMTTLKSIIYLFILFIYTALYDSMMLKFVDSQKDLLLCLKWDNVVF